MMTTQTMPIELYYWPTPNGWKISIMLEELGVPYVVRYVNIGKGEQFEPDFLKISPNNRMPAIIDPEGPGGKPISVFESGAILQYLGRKFGKFYPADERKRVEVDQWLFWQMGGLGPMAGQNHHFRNYAVEKIKYAIDRYVNETNRLYGVLNKRLADREFVAGDYSIADMASYPWVVGHKNQGQNIDDFPHLKRWLETIQARPATVRAYAKAKEVNPNFGQPVNRTEEERKILFGQTAAVVR
jgi:GST-like protein